MQFRPSFTRAAAVTAAVALGLGLAACSSGGDTPAADAPKTLTIAETVGPETFDPQATALNATWLAWELSYECLLSADETGALNPVLATSFETSEDGLTHTFTLREGVTFHDGSPFTSDDVVFTFERLLDTGLDYYKSRFKNVTSVTADGDYTVVFQLGAVDPGFLLNLADPATAGCAILSRAAATAEDPALKMIGTGPFAAGDYTANSFLELSRFEDYWGDAPSYDQLIVRYMPEASAQVAALQAGEVDLIFPAGTTVKTLEANSAVTIESVVSAAAININLNSASPALADVRVRQAVELAFDRDEIVETVLLGGGKATGLIPSGYSWAPKPADLPFYTRDVEEAKALLAEAGYADGLTLDFQYIAGYNDYVDRLGTVMQKQLADVGIELTLTPLAQPVWLENLSNAKFDLSYNAYPFFADPINYVHVRPGRSGPTPPELEAALAEARATTTPEAYIDAIVAVAELEAELAFGVVTLANTNLWVAHRQGLENVAPKMDNTRQFLFAIDITS